MIKKVKGGYQVLSSKGRNLGGPYKTLAEAKKRVRKVVEPLGESKPDWQIICSLAAALGTGAPFEFQSAEEIWNEIRCVWKAGSGITYARIKSAGLQWPCPAEDHPGTETLHASGFSAGERARLRPIPSCPPQRWSVKNFLFC